MSRTKIWASITLGSFAYYVTLGAFEMAPFKEAAENTFAASYWSGWTLIAHHLSNSSVSTDKG